MPTDKKIVQMRIMDEEYRQYIKERVPRLEIEMNKLDLNNPKRIIIQKQLKKLYPIFNEIRREDKDEFD